MQEALQSLLCIMIYCILSCEIVIIKKIAGNYPMKKEKTRSQSNMQVLDYWTIETLYLYRKDEVHVHICNLSQVGTISNPR